MPSVTSSNPRRVAGMLAVALLGFALSCAPGEEKGGTEPEPTLSRLTLSPGSATLEFGANQNFTVAGTMSDGSQVTPVAEWTATGGTVNSSGDFTAGSTAGTFQVVARQSGGLLADTSVITVVAPPPTLTSIVLSPGSVSLETSGTQQFAVIGHRSDSSTTAVTATFTETGGSISAGGLYTAGGTTGTFRVIAVLSDGSLADTSQVTITSVTPPPILTAVVLTPPSVSLQSGASQQFAATGLLSDGSSTAVTVGYSVAGGTITSGGLYTAGSTVGTFLVIATQQGGSLADTSTITITVPPPTLTAVVLSPSTATLQSGTTQQFAASGLLSNGSTTTVQVVYSATGGIITSGGLYTAGNTAGTFRVFAVQQLGTLADTSTITITPATLTSLSLTPATVTVASGATQQFAVAGTWSNGTTTTPAVTYTATGGTISSGGLYTAGGAAGTFQVIAAHIGGLLKDTSTVTVTTLTSLSLVPATVTLATGATQQFTVSATWSNGTTTAPPVIYSATGGTVSAGGLYTAGASAGTFQVVVAHNGGTLKDTSAVTITGASGGTTLLTEGFEATPLPSNWFDNRTVPLSSTEAHSGSKSLQWHWGVGTVNPQAASRVSFTPGNTVYLSYWVKQSSTWTGSGHDYHPHMFHVLTTADDPNIGPSVTHLTLYDELVYDASKGGSVPYLALQDALMIDDTKLFVDLTNTSENRSIGGYNSKNGSCGGPEPNVFWDCFEYDGGPYTNYKIFRPGTVMLDANKTQWHHVESYWQLNTISGGKGQPDGVVQYWFDGTLMLDRHDVYFRTAANPNMKFETFVMAPYIESPGSPKSQDMFIDDLLIRTTRP